MYLLLPTPASALPLEAAVGPAEPQKSFCQAALIIRIVVQFLLRSSMIISDF